MLINNIAKDLKSKNDDISIYDCDNIIDTFEGERELIAADSLIYQKIKTFPKTRYYGSKRRLLPWIYENVKHLKFDTVLDGFGGTASVSLLFKAMGKNITYNDILTSNTISAKVLLENKLAMSIESAEEFIDSIEPLEGLIYNNFKRTFYTDFENMWIDGAINSINKLNNKQKNLMLHCLFQASLMKRPYNIFHRANLNLRENTKIKRSFGNLTTWNTAFPVLMKKILFEIHRFQWDNGSVQKVLNSKPVEKIEKGYDLVYLDPPYVSNRKSGDGYLKKYHFLEGLTDYHNWEDKLNHEMKIKMLLKHPFPNDWENKNTFTKLLFNLVDKHKESIVVLSYVNNAVPSVKEISDFFESIFSKVTINTYSLNHALAKDRRNEILIIGEP